MLYTPGFPEPSGSESLNLQQPGGDMETRKVPVSGADTVQLSAQIWVTACWNSMPQKCFVSLLGWFIDVLSDNLMGNKATPLSSRDKLHTATPSGGGDQRSPTVDHSGTVREKPIWLVGPCHKQTKASQRRTRSTASAHRSPFAQGPNAAILSSIGLSFGFPSGLKPASWQSQQEIRTAEFNY